MSRDIPINLVGNVVADPELRYTSSGVPVCQLRVASTSRRLNPQTNQWEDNDPVFVTCTLWREMAENAQASLLKGTRVMVSGVLVQRRWETEAGDKRSTFEVRVEEIGPSIRWATAEVTRNVQTHPQGPAPSSGPAAPPAPPAPPAEDHWDSAPPATGSGFNADQPPF